VLGFLHIRDEGQIVRRGFNFYPLSNAFCRGFVFDGCGFRFGMRWSKLQRRIIWRFSRNRGV